MYCPECGHENEINAKFCESCGQQLLEKKEINTYNIFNSLNWKSIIIGCISGTILGYLCMFLSGGFLGLIPLPFLIGIITGYLVNKNWKNGLIHGIIGSFIVGAIGLTLFVILVSYGASLPVIAPVLYGAFLIIIGLFIIAFFLLFGAIGGILGAYISNIISK